MHLTIPKIQKNNLISGTIILTTAGVLCKGIGFFYRIFLSRTIGAQGVGLYQLVLPIFALILSFTCLGISTTISRFVSFDKQKSHIYFFIGFTTSISLSLLSSYVLYMMANPLAHLILKNEDAAPLLQIISYSIPFAAAHSCINGYCYGNRKTLLPAICQISEQCIRVATIILIYSITQKKNQHFTPDLALWGIFAGEVFSFLLCFHVLYHMKKPHLRQIKMEHLHSFYEMSVPLSFHKTLCHISNSVEYFLIPHMLMRYGYDYTTALSEFGVLTGMTLALLHSPGVLINSICVLILPEIAQAKAKCNHTLIRNLLHKILLFGFSLGILCTLLFWLIRIPIANDLFHNPLVATYLEQLCFLCPLLYIESLLQSVLNGQCYSKQLLKISLLSCAIRLLFIIIGIPIYGMKAYLWALIVSITTAVICQLFTVNHNMK